MMNVVRPGSTFSTPGPLYPPRPDVTPCPAKKPIRTDQDTSTTKPIFRPIPTKGRNTNDWTAIAWGTDIQSKTPDGMFGPAKQIKGWSDCWFLAGLAVVANDKNNQKILAQSIKKVRVEGIGGYHVTFAGLPNNNIFISDQELDQCLSNYGGDADTRIMELAADRFFSVRGNFKSMCLAFYLKAGQDPGQAEQSFRKLCRDHLIMDPMTYNPMHSGAQVEFGFFLLAGIVSEVFWAHILSPKSTILNFLHKHLTDDRDGASIVISGQKNPLGSGRYSQLLVIEWDVIRTDIISDGTVDPQERAFLNALDKWLETYKNPDFNALESAAGNLELQHDEVPKKFVDYLFAGRIDMWQRQVDLLRSGVKNLLAGGTGYIGFTGGHSGIIHGINEAADTFTYSDPNFPTMVHTGKLSDLITAIKWRFVILNAFEPKTDEDYKDDKELLEQLTPLQKLRLAIATLNVSPVKDLADYLEYLDDKGTPGNDRFGLYGVWKLSQLPLDSLLWNEIREPESKGLAHGMARKWLGIRPEYRQMIKDMAHGIVDPDYQSLTNGVHGGDGIFDPGELDNWLSKHHRDGTEPDATLFQNFYKSVQDLDEKAVGIMDWLEWQDDPKKADPDNGRFGMRGVQLLSRLTPASRQWEASGSGHLDDAWRQRLINAAKVLMNPEYDVWTFQVHKGDMIFEPDDMKNWLDGNRL